MGFKYYSGAADVIKESMTRKGCHQRLFLVRDINNPYDKEAVALHTGTKKLGHLAAAVANGKNGVFSILKQLSDELGSEAIIAVELKKYNTWDTFAYVKPIAYAPERPARKFAEALEQKGAQHGRR